MAAKLVQIVTGPYRLPNGATYATGDVAALSDTHYNAIPAADAARVAVLPSSSATAPPLDVAKRYTDTAVAGGVYPVAMADLAAYIMHGESPRNLIREALRRGYTFVHASQVLAALEGRGTLPAKPMFLSFDDGRRQLVDIVHPAVVEFGVKATSFITSDFAYQRTVDPGLQSEAPGITWSQAATLHSSGLWEWHNHTQRHVSLITQDSGTRRAELAECNRAINAELGVPLPTTIAYPFGFFDLNTINDCKAVGLRAGFAFRTRTGAPWYSTPGTHPWVIQRQGLAGDTFDHCLNTVYFHWGYDLTGERNGNNVLGYWTFPATGGLTGLTAGGEDVRVDCRTALTEVYAETADYFAVRPQSAIHFEFKGWSEVQTAGTGFIRVAQYTGSKSLLGYAICRNFSGSVNEISEGQVELDPLCRFIKIQVGGDADYNGIIHMQRGIFDRVW